MMQWYDGLQEPKRFLVFFAIMIVLLIGVNAPSFMISMISFTGLIGLTLWRMYWLRKKNVNR